MPSKDNIKVLITGDYCPHLRTESLCKEGKPESIYNEFYSELSDKDLSIVNLECPLTTSEKKLRKIGPHLKADPVVVKAFQYIGVDLVTMANNHIMDYNLSGLISTKNALSNAEIKTVGAGFTLNQASQPFTVEIKNRDVTVLNFAEKEFSIASEKHGGANPYNLVHMYDSIEKVKEKSDILILIIHGGNEHYHLPNPRMVKDFRFLAKLGVDAIVSHHTHCISGYEIYNDVPIFYGLGNFIFDCDKSINENFHTGYFIKLIFDSDGKCSFTIHPYKQFNGGVGLSSLNKLERESFDQTLNTLSTTILNDSLLSAKWNAFCNEQSNYYLESLHGYGVLPKILSRIGVLQLSPYYKMQLLRHLNYAQCESHRDAVIDILKDKAGIKK